MTENSLTYRGQTYMLSDWLTYLAYARKYGLPISTLSNRINRGNIPASVLLDVPEWGLKLIRDQPYEEPKVGPKFKKQV